MMSATVTSLREYRETGKVGKANLAAWALRIQKQMMENMDPDEREAFLKRRQERKEMA
jgi:hypothetical protein